MSSRGPANRQATKLPQFPARKSAAALEQSPGRRTRVASLPGVTPARSPTGRPDPSRWGQTGVGKLQKFVQRRDAESIEHEPSEDDPGDVDGFESPKQAEVRAQVARDEVLSYMHRRSHQRDGTGKEVNARPEPHDTSFDDSDGNDRQDSSAKPSARDPSTPDSAGDPTRLVHRVQQVLDRWPQSKQSTQHHSFVDDDVQPFSGDQSPTRHNHIFPEDELPEEPGRQVDRRCGGELSMIQLTSTCQELGGRRGSAREGLGHVSLHGASLSENTYGAFKREVAARVIQKFWRKWQDWKAKLRREAEERILQQLLADDSGFSLQMLLRDGGSDGGLGFEEGDSAAGKESSNNAEGMAPASPHHANEIRPAGSLALTIHSDILNHGGGPLQPRRNVGSSGGGLERGVASSSATKAGRSLSARVTLRTSATTFAGGKSPERGGRNTALSAVSPGFGGRSGSRRPGARREGGLGQGGSSFDYDDLKDVNGGDHEVNVKPSRKHTGGHAVYTFVATPNKQVVVDTLAVEATRGQDHVFVRGVPEHAADDTSCRSAYTSCPDAGEATDQLAANATDVPLDGMLTQPQDLRHQPATTASPCRPAPRQQQKQPSLDADINPAMASPELSMGTGRSSRDSAAVSPDTSLVMPSSHVISQLRSTTRASRLSDTTLPAQLQPEDQNPLDGDSRLKHSSCLETVPRQVHRAVPHQSLTPCSRTAVAGQLQEQRQRSAVPNQCDIQEPPLSPTSTCWPHEPQRDASPSPQRKNRMEALQRLKTQGSLRGGALYAGGQVIAAQPLGPTQVAALASVLPQTLAFDASKALDCRLDDQHRETRPIAPSGEPQQPRARRKVWQEDVGDEKLKEALRPQHQDGYNERVRPPGRTGESQRQLQHPAKQQTNGGSELGQRQLSHRDKQPDQQSTSPVGNHGFQQHNLSKEARLQSSNEPAAAVNQEKAAGCCSPSLQPRAQDPKPTPPRACAPNAGRQASASQQCSPLVQATRVQQQSQTLGMASTQLPLVEPNQPADPAMAQGNCYATSRRVSQFTCDDGQRSGPKPVRPVSATAAQGSRACGPAEARTALRSRITIGGDEGSLERLIAARGQQQEHAPARIDNNSITPRAWPEGPSGALVAVSLGCPEEQQLQARALVLSVQGSNDDSTPGDAADVLGSSASGVGNCHGSSRPCTDGGIASSSGQASRGAGVKRGSSVGSGGGWNGKKEGDSGGDSRAGNAEMGVTVDDSLTAQKMSSILKFLDEVEMQAKQEATCFVLAPELLAKKPSAAEPLIATVFMPTPPSKYSTGSFCGDGGDGGCCNARRYASPSVPGTSKATRQIATASRPGTAYTAAPFMDRQLQRSQAALSYAGMDRRHSRNQRFRSSMAGSLAEDGSGEAEPYGDFATEDDRHMDNEDDAVSLATRSMAAGMTSRPAFLAESVYETVRAKIVRFQDDIKQRDVRIKELTQEIESMQVAQRTCLLDADARLTEMLAAQRAEYEAAVSRHMAFVDRLLADKEALTTRAQQLAEQVKAADEQQERAIAKLKDGWAAELKRQKEIWTAGEKQRREAWMQSKAAEIKDVTVKGLEGEVQKLLTRHRAELSAAQKAAADEAKRHLDTYVAQNEAAVRQLKERMSREVEEAVEKERCAATARLREVSERYEQQMQTQRMRLVAGADLKIEQLEQARKEDKKRYEEALATAKEAGEARLKEAEEDGRREKEAIRKAHDKQIDALREQYEMGQEGWRAAMAERARKEVSERVAAIKEKLLQERNEEVEAVMRRLEAEHAAAVEALKEDFRRREEAAAARAASAVKEARRAEAKMAERFRNAGLSAKAVDERLAVSEVTVRDLRRELEARNDTIKWLESQVSAAKDEAAVRERDIRSLGDEKAAVAAEVAAAAARDKQQVEARLAQALQETQELRSRHTAEMAAVEARVRATLARKDEVIHGLREHLTAMEEELRSTQEVLRQQQEELGSEVGSGSNAGTAGREVLYGEMSGRRGGGWS